jgi:hypothetical protein
VTFPFAPLLASLVSLHMARASLHTPRTSLPCARPSLRMPRVSVYRQIGSLADTFATARTPGSVKSMNAWFR